MHIKNKIVCVTGAAGFIGSNLCRALFKENNTVKVVGIDNLNNYYNVKIKERRIKELSQNNRFIFYKASILDKDTIVSLAAKHKPDVLIHAAAEVGVRNGELHTVEYFSTNVLGTLITLEAASRYIQQAVVFSSSSVYGSTKRLPLRESEPLLQSTPLSTYGASKLAMEIAVQNFYKRTKIPVTIVRPFSIYGPDGRPDMLPIKLLIAAKTNKPVDIYAPAITFRDWTYIDDCVKIILSILRKPDGFRILNIGLGQPIRLNAVINYFQNIVRQHGYSIQYKQKPVNSTEMIKTWADTTRLTKLCQFSEQISYKEGFKKTADFFFSHLGLYIK